MTCVWIVWLTAGGNPGRSPPSEGVLTRTERSVGESPQRGPGENLRSAYSMRL
jgi:hypothetical protein